MKKVIKMENMENIPLTESGEPDIAAILAANGLSGIDLSKVKIIKGDDNDKEKILKNLL